MLELVNTDTYVRDALWYGLEGDNFEYVDDKIRRLNTDWTMAAYTQGSFFTASMEEHTVVNQWDELRYQNEHAIASPALGFHFDTTPVAGELQACISIYQSYAPLLLTGAEDPARIIPLMLEEMTAAGFDTILTEAQTQLDDWSGQ